MTPVYMATQQCVVDWGRAPPWAMLMVRRYDTAGSRSTSSVAMAAETTRSRRSSHDQGPQWEKAGMRRPTKTVPPRSLPHTCSPTKGQPAARKALPRCSSHRSLELVQLLAGASRRRWCGELWCSPPTPGVPTTHGQGAARDAAEAGPRRVGDQVRLTRRLLRPWQEAVRLEALLRWVLQRRASCPPSPRFLPGAGASPRGGSTGRRSCRFSGRCRRGTWPWCRARRLARRPGLARR